MNPLALAHWLAAAEESSGGEARFADINFWHIGPDYAEKPAVGLMAITFIVFAGALVYFVRPKLATYLENRSDAVRKAIEEAKRAKEDAEARARDAEAKLARLAQDMVALKKDFEEQGKAELDRIEKIAEEAAVRIAKDAEDTIAAESERARQALRAEAAKLALEMAEERIRAALDKNDDARLQKALVDGLGEKRPSA